jgi:hypothetical protein
VETERIAAGELGEAWVLEGAIVMSVEVVRGER